MTPQRAVRSLRRRSKRLRARSRLREVNLRRTAAAVSRPVPAPPRWPDHVAVGRGEVTYGAPRTLLFVTVKRDNPSWRELYGHWWVEVGEESYGWWPRAVPVGLRELLTGTSGVLNGMGLLNRSGTWHRDAQHGCGSMHAFHPVLTVALCDNDVRSRLRDFAHAYRGSWHWSWKLRGQHDTCRSFQDALLRAAELHEGIEHLPSRGSGCPFLYGPRTLLWWLQDQTQRCRQSFDRRAGGV